jgi:predicted lipoprotein with Yx(FWY)xxD motif
MASAPTSRPAADDGRPRPIARWLCLLMATASACALATACGATGAATSMPTYEVLARAVPGLGTIITDGRGFTLYMYAPDNRGASRCYGFCAQQWPPLLLPPGVTRPVAGPGVRAALLGTVRRTGGQLQATYGGWPLYRWIGDTAPGQATGQADDMGLWYVMSAAGAVDRGTVR